jgi:hypothetical protein
VSLVDPGKVDFDRLLWAAPPVIFCMLTQVQVVADRAWVVAVFLDQGTPECVKGFD